jgi:uncharacterized glyoxalase superfamily protein PhnB
MALKGLSPYLQVDDLDETIRYYETVLGFTCAARMEDDWARIDRDDVSIMLSPRHGERKNEPTFMTGSIYILANPVDELWEELKDKARIPIRLRLLTTVCASLLSWI